MSSTMSQADHQRQSDILNAVRTICSADSGAQNAINLVPSETRLSPLAQLPLHTDFYNRYFFNEALSDDYWQFRGAESVAHLEGRLAKDHLSKLANAAYVNVRPVSGMSAMVLAISAMMPEKRSQSGILLSIDPNTGGHYATASVAERLGYKNKLVRAHSGRVDITELERALRAEPVDLIYLDIQNSLTHANVRDVSLLIARHSPMTLFHVDSSHTLGLILGGVLPNPLDEGADSFGGSTHKTFPGPHKGVLFTRDKAISERIESAQFDLISSHHFAETLSLGLAAAEFTLFGRQYAQQVIQNARQLAQDLSELGLHITSHSRLFTDTHQVWVETTKDEARFMSQSLADWGIRVNVQDDLPGLFSPSLRLGLNEVTLEGANHESITLLAQAIAASRKKRGGRNISASDIKSTFSSPYWVTMESLTQADPSELVRGTTSK